MSNRELPRRRGRIGRVYHCKVFNRRWETFRTGRSELFAAYTTWAKQFNERHPMERNQFYEAIRRREGIWEYQYRIKG